MKKYFYLCCVLLLSMNTMAQIDPHDQNWECFINEDFSGVRSWNNYWDDTRDTANYQSLWRCFAYHRWNSGVTGNVKRERHAYQKDHAVFDPVNHTLRLIEELKSQDSLHCGSGYSPAPWLKYCHFCDEPQNQHPNVHYHTGMIESIDPVGYGYYEIECKMPIHKGAYSAFWFWGNLGNKYGEIDVFEHCQGLCDTDLATETLSGIWYNPDSTNLSGTGVPIAHRYGDCRNYLSTNAPTLEAYHTFGCLWLPEKVAFYIDGEAIGEFSDPDFIPPHPMWLKVTLAEDLDARVVENNDSVWGEWRDEMTVNYIKGYRLKTDCNTDVTIRSVTDFSNFVYSTKHTITMGGLTGSLTIPGNSVFTMRAVESITIDGELEVPQGVEMTLMVHDCPQCSMEGVVLPNYSCGMNGVIDE